MTIPSDVILLHGRWGFGFRHAASSVRHTERVSASMAGPSLCTAF